MNFGACGFKVRTLGVFLPINVFSIEPLEVKLLAWEQKASELSCLLLV